MRNADWDASQWVEETIPNVPVRVGRVVNVIPASCHQDARGLDLACVVRKARGTPQRDGPRRTSMRSTMQDAPLTIGR